jgi:hypothetical protein
LKDKMTGHTKTQAVEWMGHFNEKTGKAERQNGQGKQAERDLTKLATDKRRECQHVKAQN